MDKFYLTTPIYYVNASPHIGHAYTDVISDCVARYRRLKGERVFFLTGTDEHGEKIERSAEKAGTEVKSFVDKVSENFVNLFKALDISYDYFIRTTQATHIKVVQEAIRFLHNKGDIYQAKYRGFYCMPCELFWNDSQVKEAGGCPDCKRPVEEVEEENYFFKLSKYENWLKDYIKNNPGFIKPNTRYNEVVGFLENNRLVDLCITRPKKRVSWGIEFPTDNRYVVYVWFDALLNYLSGVGFYFDKERFSEWWPADIHFMAKDILKQHAIYWPIMLKALELEMPRVVYAHGWWKIGEDKISKSKGNIINPYEIFTALGGPSSGVDALRYFLLREVPVGMDGSFSWQALISRTNSDLANDLGNLVYRTLNMAEKYFQGRVEASSREIPLEFKEAFASLSANYGAYMENIDFSHALGDIFSFIAVMNKYIEDKKPWVLWKEKKQEAIANFLYAILEGIRIISIYLFPFIPRSFSSISRQLGLGETQPNLNNIQWSLKEGYSVRKEAPLFPRIDVD